MNKKLFLMSLLIFFLKFLGIYSYDIYSGEINGNKIEVYLEINNDGINNDVSGIGVYSYNKYGIPISFDAKLKNGILILKNEKEKMTFKNFNIKKSKIIGEWENSKNKFKIKLSKELKFDSYDTNQFENLEVLAPASTKNEFFKFVLKKKKKEDSKVIGINIYSKKNKFLLQRIKLDAKFIGLHGLEIGDYNFDGIEDFSVFESYYAGPNTSSLYILRDKEINKFYLSSFTGTSLEFYFKNKYIRSHNQTRAGASHLIKEFIVEDNEMLLTKYISIEYEYDENSNNVNEKIYEVGGDKPYTGIIKNFYLDNNLSSETNYVYGKRNGFEREYNSDGKLISETNFKNEKMEGLFKEFYKNGQLRIESNYVNNKLDGISRDFYENGNLKKDQIYKNGKKNGFEREYNPDGKLISEINFKNGEIEGLVKEFYKNGKLKYEGNFENGRINGIYKEFYENEQLKIEINANNDKLDAVTRKFNNIGELIEEKVYINGILKNDRLIKDKILKDGIDAIKSKHN